MKDSNMEMTWPDELAINAWTGEKTPSSKTGTETRRWTLRSPVQVDVRQTLAPAPEADLNDWRDPRVGWGLVLPERPGTSYEILASGEDAPEPIRRLLKARANAPVFRYRPGLSDRFTHLRNYASGKDVAIANSPRGLGNSALPMYLLLYGTPEELPWTLQYNLNAVGAVGRLDLTDQALDNYITALLGEWKDSTAKVGNAVVWATDMGNADITHLMRNAIAQKMAEKLGEDKDIDVRFLDGKIETATASGLKQALKAQKPQFILTTSHGQTGPLTDAAAMKAHLGFLVDQNYDLLDPQTLLADWQPEGAIWYAHACCSAGSDSPTIFDKIVPDDSEVAQTLTAIARLGAMTSPTPRALLGAPRPLRAFIGHVEPTFDWTLRQPRNGQFLTSNLLEALYTRLFLRKTVGYAFQQYYRPLAGLYMEGEQALKAFDLGEDTLATALYCQLASRDTQSLVILGDPTVAFAV